MKKITATLLMMLLIINSNLAFMINDSGDSALGQEPENPYLRVIGPEEAGDQYFVDPSNNVHFKWNTITFLRTSLDDQEKSRKLKINSIASNGKIFVAVGDRDLILTSTDQQHWTEVMTVNFNHIGYNILGKFKKVIWTGKAFLAFSDNPRYYAYSVDGMSWEEISFGRDYSIYNAFVFNSKIYLTCTDAQNGLYAASAMILVSQDGKKWTRCNFKNMQESIMGSRPLYTIAYDGKRYLAAGNHGTLATSSDGLNWTGIGTSKEASKALSSNNWEEYSTYKAYFLEFQNLIWDGKRFVGSGTDSSDGNHIPKIITSKDGLKWSTLSSWDQDHRYHDLQWNGKEYYLTMGKHCVYEPEILDSPYDYINLTGVYVSKDAKKWDKVVEYQNIQPNGTTLINDQVHLFGDSIYIGSRVASSTIPKEAKKISIYKTNTKKVTYPRMAYDIDKNPKFEYELPTAIDHKPLVFPQDSAPLAYKESLERLSILYPVDILLAYVGGTLTYDQGTGFYIAKYMGREKFRIKPNSDNFTYMKADGTQAVKSFKKFGKVPPQIYNGKIYMDINFVMEVFGRKKIYELTTYSFSFQLIQ